MRVPFGFLLVVLGSTTVAQQVSDTLFKPSIKKAYNAIGTGPTVLIDEAHYNFHTALGRFRPFAMLLERDGFQIRRGTKPFSKESLQGVSILVISNALSSRNQSTWE